MNTTRQGIELMTKNKILCKMLSYFALLIVTIL